MYSYGWAVLMYGRNQHNIVIILQLKIIKKEKREGASRNKNDSVMINVEIEGRTHGEQLYYFKKNWNHYIIELTTQLKDNQGTGKEGEPSSYGQLRRLANQFPQSNSKAGKNWQKLPFQCPGNHQS